MPAKHFPHLFSEGQIGNIEIKNRIVMLPMAASFKDLMGKSPRKQLIIMRSGPRGASG